MLAGLFCDEKFISEDSKCLSVSSSAASPKDFLILHTGALPARPRKDPFGGGFAVEFKLCAHIAGETTLVLKPLGGLESFFQGLETCTVVLQEILEAPV